MLSFYPYKGKKSKPQNAYTLQRQIATLPATKRYIFIVFRLPQMPTFQGAILTLMLTYQEKGALPPLATLVPRGLFPSALQSRGLQYQECLSGAKTEGKRVRNELFFSAEIRSAYTCRASWGYGLKVAQAGSTKARVSEATS